MTEAQLDVLVIGSGPAGMWAAKPLVDAGLSVKVIDGGRRQELEFPKERYHEWRKNSDDSSSLLFDHTKKLDFEALSSTSPKLRVPTLRYTFDDYLKTNQIKSEESAIVGSLAVGGLSNAWGCGVAGLNAADNIAYKFPRQEYEKLQAAHRLVAEQIGISGDIEDDLSEYFSLKSNMSPAIPSSKICDYILSKYEVLSNRTSKSDFLLGSSRAASITYERNNRLGCNQCGNCLLGCHRKSLYSARFELEYLSQYNNFVHEPGTIVSEIGRDIFSPFVIASKQPQGVNQKIRAKNIILAAGTLVTTRLVFNALNIKSSSRLLNNPTAAFMLWVPKFLGSKHETTYSLSSLSFTVGANDVRGFGSLFPLAGVPMSNFNAFLPFSRKLNMKLFKETYSSMLIGNLFLPGHMTENRLEIDQDLNLNVKGRFKDGTGEAFEKLHKILNRRFRKFGAYLIPYSFKLGQHGSDIHYAGTLPMKQAPKIGETDIYGQLHGLDGFHVVDGACLPALSEKSHTLTIMANAYRIGQRISLIKN